MPANLISRKGQEEFLWGLNYPWWNYGTDFGRSAWGHAGASAPGVREKIECEFATLSSAGVRIIRWFVFCDGRAGVQFDAAGMPARLDECVIPDLDSALSLAEKHELVLNLVLLDSHWMLHKRVSAGVPCGGHARVINQESGQRALIERLFEPLLRRYAVHPAIFSWEVMNEPEWIITEFGASRARCEPSILANFRCFVRLVADVIHELTSSIVTLGSAKAKWLKNWAGLGLDYYQAHYWHNPGNPDDEIDLYRVPYDSLNLDAPLVIGEFPANPVRNEEAGYTPPPIAMTQYLHTFRAGDYAGAWPWSFRGDDFGAIDLRSFSLSSTRHL